jgi:mono/diheme cytochrome c family protein
MIMALWSALAFASPDSPAEFSVPAQMHVHFALVSQARMAVEKGDLVAAKARAAELVALQAPTGITEPWKPFVVELKADAAALGESKTLGEAGRRVAAIAITCAECHTQKGGGPQVLPAAPDEKLSASAGRDMLWLALITRSDDAWRRGAAAQSDKGLVEATTPDARALAFATLMVP